MEIFDSHAHFGPDAGETAAMLERAFAAGVSRVMAVGGDESADLGARIAARLAHERAGSAFPKVVFATGRDRDQISPDAAPPDYTGAAAVGEIGLDYHYSPETRDAQTALFAAQLENARKLGLPVIIHTRDADDDTLAILREIPSRGVIHSFTGSPDFGRKLLDLGFFVSISGIVTFKSADNVRAAALSIPEDRLLVETDTPFLAPVPMRGRQNEPGFVVHTLEFLATLRGVPAERLAAATTANAISLFGDGETA